MDVATDQEGGIGGDLRRVGSVGGRVVEAVAGISARRGINKSILAILFILMNTVTFRIKRVNAPV